MFVIGKQPEFDRDNLPVRGQCQPQTNGWRLFIFHKGKENVLLSGNYYLCRRLQNDCIGHTDEEAVAIAAKYKAEQDMELRAPTAVKTTMPPCDLEGETPDL